MVDGAENSAAPWAQLAKLPEELWWTLSKSPQGAFASIVRVGSAPWEGAGRDGPGKPPSSSGGKQGRPWQGLE